MLNISFGQPKIKKDIGTLPEKELDQFIDNFIEDNIDIIDELEFTVPEIKSELDLIRLNKPEDLNDVTELTDNVVLKFGEDNIIIRDNNTQLNSYYTYDRENMVWRDRFKTTTEL